MPPSSTPRTGGKGAHHEIPPPPPSIFPLPSPFNERMIGFGCPDVAVPTDYLGPRKEPFPKEKNSTQPETLSEMLQSHLSLRVGSDPSLHQISAYDLSHVDLSSAHVLKQACLVWKQPVRRASVRDINLTQCNLSDESARIFSAFLQQAPSALAPLALQKLTLDDNGLWARGFGSILSAFAHNPFASVEELYWSNGHIGAKGGESQTNTQAYQAAEAAKVAAAEAAAALEAEQHHKKSEASRRVSPSPQPHDDEDDEKIATFFHHPFPLFSTEFASSCYSPLIDFLTAPHCKLKKLHLAQQKLSDIFVAYLAEGLRRNQSLEELVLDQNEISDVGIKLLAAALGGKREEEEASEVAAQAQAAQAHLAAAEALAAEEDAKSHRSAAGGHHKSVSIAKGPAAVAGGKTSASSTQRPIPASVLVSPNKKGLGGKDKGHHDAEATTAEETEKSHDPLLAVLPVFPASSSTNQSLRVLKLRANRLTSQAARHIESASRFHSCLLEVDLSSQRLPAHSSRGEYEALECLSHKIREQCLQNGQRFLKVTRAAFALGFHSRIGAHSPLQALVATAREQAKAVAIGGGTAAEEGREYSSSSRGSTSQSQRRGIQVSTPLHIPPLPIATAESRASRIGTASATAAVAAPSAPHAQILTCALEQVWQYIGADTV